MLIVFIVGYACGIMATLLLVGLLRAAKQPVLIEGAHADPGPDRNCCQMISQVFSTINSGLNP
jgi:hypothetical protein